MVKAKVLFVLLCFLSLTSEIHAQRIMNQIMDNPPEILMQQNSEGWHPNAKMLGPGLFGHTRPQFEIYSPSVKKFAGTENGNLYFRAEDSEELEIVISPSEGWYWNMDNALWSHDGNYLVAKQIDNRDVPKIKLTMASPDSVVYKTYSRAGQALPKHQFYIINATTGGHIKVEQNPNFPYAHVMDWSSDNTSVYMLESDRLMKELNLRVVETSSGKSSILLSEQSNTYLVGLNLLQGYSNRLRDMKLVSFLEGRNQFIWMSERSGFNQLYLYDLEGNLISPLTNYSQNGIVVDIEDIDLKNDWVYFTAHSDSENPYSKQLFKVGLSSNKIEIITDTSGFLDLLPSDNKDTLWVMRSSLPRMLQIDRMTPEGKYIKTLWKGNFSQIAENHFNFEYAKILAADHKTNLEAFILKPSNFDANKSYPVVEYIYGASFTNVVDRDLFSPWLWDMNDLAQKGFIVVFIDGRGTSGRGKDFKDFSYGKFGQIELQDHIYGLKQLAKDRPYMNMDKVGVLGHSWGGHFALRALLEAPEFYKAGHINAAAIDPQNFRVAIEPFMGCLPQDCPEQYQKSNISNQLNRLKAPLIIAHGTADDDVPIDDAYFLVQKLNDLGYKNYEFIEYQGMDHIIMRNPEWKPKMIQFFIEHLN
ncbi:dipeptidyl aminopeptidase/acylaminoacyl peptidase [Flavobacteriaceae bacterium MAR_2010_72]|nr:dipeptidyl aminopeptidase/acylaminoacyl peptidase [Flavobacteriaceae bacterium MAR_2010_72]